MLFHIGLALDLNLLPFSSEGCLLIIDFVKRIGIQLLIVTVAVDEIYSQIVVVFVESRIYFVTIACGHLLLAYS